MMFSGTPVACAATVAAVTTATASFAAVGSVSSCMRSRW